MLSARAHVIKNKNENQPTKNNNKQNFNIVCHVAFLKLLFVKHFIIKTKHQPTKNKNKQQNNKNKQTNNNNKQKTNTKKLRVIKL